LAIVKALETPILRQMSGATPYIPRKDRIIASRTDPLTIMVSRNRQTDIGDITRVEQRLAELADERNRLMRHVSANSP
jgi:hypothetical protein